MTGMSVIAIEDFMDQSQFEIIQSLGSGATAEVFKARNRSTDSFVALKSFLNFISQDQDSLKRLREEIQILKTFDHPNVVKMYGEHMLENQLCLELELVEGHHLRDWMNTTRNPLIEVDLWILVQVARGLGAVHERGIIHRDLKPENILISYNGDVKLSDFGLAKELNRLTMTRLGLLVGSLGYMAPEVTEGEKSCIKSDLFSFGAIAYELLSGQPPIYGDTAQAILKKAMEPVPPLATVCPHVHPRVAHIVDQCLKQSKDDRPESIWSVESELMGVLNDSGLLPKCRDLVAASPSQKVFKESLTMKRDNLVRQVEEAEQSKKIDKKLLLSLANEFQRLFPEDPTGIELLALLRNQKSFNWKHPIVLAPLILVFSALLLYSLIDWTLLDVEGAKQPDLQAKESLPPESAISKGSIPEPSEVKASTVPKSQNTKKPEPISKTKPATVSDSKPPSQSQTTTKKKTNGKPKAQKPAASVKKKSPPPAPMLGTLTFEVDDDVDIFVDGKKVPRQQLENFKVKPGMHQFKMIKAGFDPIDNEIEVKAGKTTTIRAKGGA